MRFNTRLLHARSSRPTLDRGGEHPDLPLEHLPPGGPEPQPRVRLLALGEPDPGGPRNDPGEARGRSHGPRLLVRPRRADHAPGIGPQWVSDRVGGRRLRRNLAIVRAPPSAVRAPGRLRRHDGPREPSLCAELTRGHGIPRDSDQSALEARRPSRGGSTGPSSPRVGGRGRHVRHARPATTPRARGGYRPPLHHEVPSGATRISSGERSWTGTRRSANSLPGCRMRSGRSRVRSTASSPCGASIRSASACGRMERARAPSPRRSPGRATSDGCSLPDCVLILSTHSPNSQMSGFGGMVKASSSRAVVGPRCAS